MYTQLAGDVTGRESLLFSHTELSCLGEHSEVSQARSLQQNFDSDPKEAWHYNHVTFTRIAKNFMLYCRLIYMLSILYVRLTIKVKVRIPKSFKVGWQLHKITGSSHLNSSHLNERQYQQSSVNSSNNISISIHQLN